MENDQWRTGAVRGLKARGGYEIDIKWENGQLVSAGISADTTGDVKIIYKGKEKTVSLKANSKTTIEAHPDRSRDAPETDGRRE